MYDLMDLKNHGPYYIASLSGGLFLTFLVYWLFGLSHKLVLLGLFALFTLLTYFVIALAVVACFIYVLFWLWDTFCGNPM